MKVIRKRLYESEGLPDNVRWDETCGCVQSLFGDEWIDNPDADPRFNPANLAPPNDTSDPRCSAAYGMRAKIENIMNAFFAASALIDAANAVLALITVTVPGVGLIWRVVFAVIEALYAIGSAALVIAFDNDAYDELQCIFYAEISADGQMTQEQFVTINTRICTDMDVTICAAMGLLMNMLGYVGMSNAGAQYGEDADCSDCPDDWCWHDNFSDPDVVWNGTTYAPYGAVKAGGSWRQVTIAGGYFYCQIFNDFPGSTLTTITEVSFTALVMPPTNNAAGCSGWAVGLWIGGVETYPVAYAPQTVGSFVTYTITGSWENVAGISFHIQQCPSGGVGGSIQMTEYTIKGTGYNPYPDSNCPP